MPTMTLRLDEENGLAPDALAKATDRSKSYLALPACSSSKGTRA